MPLHGDVRRTGRPYPFARLSSILVVLATFCTALVLAGNTPPSALASASGPRGSYGAGQLMAAAPQGGYWVASVAGGVAAYGGAPSLGSPAASDIALSKPVVGMAATPDGKGYWLVASDGGIFSYGDASFFGSTGSIHLNRPIVGMAVTTDGDGYWLVASDGGIFSYGDAAFYGSTGSIRLNEPVVGMAATSDGNGYWLVASDGGVFSYGDARFYGSTGSIRLGKPIVGMAATPDGNGYWLVASDGGIFSYGNAPFYGSLGGGGEQVLGMVVTPSTGGYFEIGAAGDAHVFGPAAQSQQTSAGSAGGEPSGVTSPNVQSGTTETIAMPSATIAGDPSQLNCQPSALPTATPDQTLDGVFSGQVGPGWIGGDSTYSTPLPDGRDAFVFSDTLLGTANSDGAASLTGFVHNSELVGNVPNLSTVVGSISGSPQSLIPDADGPNDLWLVSDTDVENGNQLVFVNEFAVVSGSPFYTYLGHSAIAVMALPTGGQPTFNQLIPVPTDPNTQWGTALAQSGGYTYVYGSDLDPSTGNFSGMKVARIPVGRSVDTSAWTYWNGSQFVAGEANALPVVTGNVLTGVIPLNGAGFMAVSIPGGVDTVDLSFSCNPYGPWSTPQAVYTIPELDQYRQEIAYAPTFHAELMTNGLLVSYNVDTIGSLSQLEQNVHAYQPRFLLLIG